MAGSSEWYWGMDCTGGDLTRRAALLTADFPTDFTDGILSLEWKEPELETILNGETQKFLCKRQTKPTVQ